MSHSSSMVRMRDCSTGCRDIMSALRTYRSSLRTMTRQTSRESAQLKLGSGDARGGSDVRSRLCSRNDDSVCDAAVGSMNASSCDVHALLGGLIKHDEFCSSTS